MAEKKTYTCDVCGAERHEANHWFGIGQAGDILHISPFITGRSACWHVCGEACVMKKVSEFLDKWRKGTGAPQRDADGSDGQALIQNELNRELTQNPFGKQ